jgi:hypothetical protein
VNSRRDQSGPSPSHGIVYVSGSQLTQSENPRLSRMQASRSATAVRIRDGLQNREVVAGQHPLHMLRRIAS